jgi:hypothetical protein
MGIPLIFLAVELTVLWLISRRLTQNLYISSFLLTKSREISIGFLSLLFFPGTVIHELAHMFVAEILQVHTSGLTLVPEGLEQTQVRTGSVSIAQSDPIRRAVIGIAPVFVGLGMLGLISYYLPTLWQQVTVDSANGILFSTASIYLLFLALYSLFAVSNTMFSSPEDMEGFWPVAIVLILIFAALYIVGIRISLTDTVLISLQAFFTSAATNIGLVLGLNILLFILSKLMIAGVEKITKRKLVAKQN